MKAGYRRLSSKLFFSAFIIVIYILGQAVPIPWIQSQEIKRAAGNDVFLLIQSIIGADRERTSVFALGLMPWMTASIIVQLSGLARREKGRISGESVQRKIRFLTLLFAVANAYIRSEAMEYDSFIYGSFMMTRAAVILTMIAGSFVVLWMAEQNSVKGIGGVVLIILVNILRNAGRIVSGVIFDFMSGKLSETDDIKMIISIIVIGLVGIIVMVIFENSEIRLPVQRVMINSEMAADNYIAIKLNPAGTQPIMYVMAFYLLPYYCMQILDGLLPGNRTVHYIAENIDLSRPLGLALYMVVFVFIAVSLAYVQISPADIAEQMEQKGDCITGIRPGKETERCLKRVVMNHSLLSTVIVGVLIGIPMMLRILWNAASEIFMLPMFFMIITGIMQNIFIEMRVIKKLDHYGPVL